MWQSVILAKLLHFVVVTDACFTATLLLIQAHHLAKPDAARCYPDVCHTGKLPAIVFDQTPPSQMDIMVCKKPNQTSSDPGSETAKRERAWRVFRQSGNIKFARWFVLLHPLGRRGHRVYYLIYVCTRCGCHLTLYGAPLCFSSQDPFAIHLVLLVTAHNSERDHFLFRTHAHVT